MLVATVCAASPVYPGTVKRTLGLQKIPQCTLCHQSLAGGTGTAVQPFALAVRERGLTGLSNIQKLQEVLAQLETEAVDTDGDGVGDIAELKAGTNPNPQAAAPDGGTPKELPPSTQAGGSSGMGGAGTWIVLAVAGAAIALVAVLLLTRKKSPVT